MRWKAGCITQQQCLISGQVMSIPSYEQRMVPAVSEDRGYGISSVSSNTPYSSVRQTVTPSVPNQRVMMTAVPQIPKDATQHTWAMSLKTNIKDFPEWQNYVHGVTRSQFALQFNGSEALRSKQSPASFTIEFEGMVYYSHGSRKFQEQEIRVGKLIVYQHVHEDAEVRGVQNSFAQQKSNNESTAYETIKHGGMIIPTFTMERGESFTFHCGGNQHNQQDSCVVGDNNQTQPIWGDENSRLVFHGGVVVIRSPIALYNGWIEIRPNTIVIVDGTTATSTVAIMSLDRVTRFINDGKLIIRKGIFRLNGSSMFGRGTIDVLEDSRLEVDPNQDVSFGTEDGSGMDDHNAASPTGQNQMMPSQHVHVQHEAVIRNQGNVTFVSGITGVDHSIVVVGLGQLTVGMAAELKLRGTSTHILGGMNDGVTTLNTSTGVYAFGTKVDGRLVLERSSKILAGSGIRVQGQGSIHIEPQSILQINIEFYDPIKYPDAAIITTGPGSERVRPGITNEGTISIKRGGIKVSTGIVALGESKQDITDNGYQHIIGYDTVNHFRGTYVINNGDISVVSGASVNFETALQSSSTITVYSDRSVLLFSGRTSSIITRNYVPSVRAGGVGTNGRDMTHQSDDVSNSFALFNPGSLQIKDSARLRLMVPSSNGASDRVPPRFYCNIVQNAGSQQQDFDVRFEVTHYMQDYQASTVLEPLTEVSIPHTGVFGSNAALVVVPSTKYAISQKTGTIVENASINGDGTQKDEKPITIMSGYVGGTDGGMYDGVQHIGRNAVIAPGSIFPTLRQPIKDSTPTVDETTQPWRTLAYTTASSGIIKCKKLVGDRGSTIVLDLQNLESVNENYDRIFVDDSATFNSTQLNITTLFESQAYQGSSMNTFVHNDARRVFGPQGRIQQQDSNVNRYRRNRNQYSTSSLDQVSQYVGGVRTLSVVDQQYNGRVVNTSTTMSIFAQSGFEVFRIPIITTGSQNKNSQFSKVTVNWMPSGEVSAGRYTTQQHQGAVVDGDIIDHQMYSVLYNRQEKHMEVLQHLVDTSAAYVGVSGDVNHDDVEQNVKSVLDTVGPVHLALEYDNNDIYQLGYSQGSGQTAYASFNLSLVSISVLACMLLI